MCSWTVDAALARDAGEAAAQLRRVEQDVAAGWPVQAGVPQRGVDLVLGGVAVQELEVLAVLGGLVDPGPELVDLVGLVGQGERAGLLEVAVDAVLAGERDQRPGGCRCPPAPSRGSSSGKCRMPLARPWVRLASQKPPLRPLAPKATVSASSTDDPQGRVGVGQGDRRPQAGEARADDGDVDVQVLPGVSGGSAGGPGSRSQ